MILHEAAEGSYIVGDEMVLDLVFGFVAEERERERENKDKRRKRESNKENREKLIFHNLLFFI